MKNLISLITFGILISCSTQTEVNFIEGDLSQALALARSMNKIVLIDMYSDN